MSLLRTSLIVIATCVTAFTVAAGAHAAPGDLDAAFGTAGVATAASGPDFDDAEPTEMAVAPDGKIVIVGRLAGPSDAYAFVLRLLPSGALDPDFATGGVLLTRLGPDFAQFTSVLVQPNRRIVVGGSVRNTGQDYPVIARFTEDGGLDPTFNALGGSPGMYVSTSITANNAAINSLAIRPDGSFVGTGVVEAPQRFWFTLGIKSTGELDTSFNGRDIERLRF